jgi:KDO2-lipid IV(A) lauroyltransferase
VKHRVEYLAVRLLTAVVSLLPMPAVRRLGAAVGRAAYAVDAAHRRIAIENLAAAFPGRQPAEHRALARATFAHFGSLLLELLKFATYSADEMLAAVEIEGEDRVRQAQQQGRGILFFTGHFGYWEIQAIVHALRGYPTSVLARRLDNPHLHRLLERIRTKTGGAVIYRQGAVRRMLRELALNHSIAVLIDQHLHSDAILVDFFQRPAATTSALAALAMRTGAAVIPVFALPLPNGRYRLIYEHSVDLPPAASGDAVHALTQRCTDVLEMYVRRHPHLWLWMHRRWRDRGIEQPIDLTEDEADAE